MIHTTPFYNWLLDALADDHALRNPPAGITEDESRMISDAWFAALPRGEDYKWQVHQEQGVRAWIRRHALACMGVPS